jgi:hypothetical protein
MPLFGGKKQTAFEIRLNPTRREKIAMARAGVGDKAIRILAREKKKEAERQALVDQAEEIKEKAEKRRADQAAADKKAKAAARAKRTTEPEKTGCTCRKPKLKGGKCTRCHKAPAVRRGGFRR